HQSASLGVPSGLVPRTVARHPWADLTLRQAGEVFRKNCSAAWPKVSWVAFATAAADFSCRRRSVGGTPVSRNFRSNSKAKIRARSIDVSGHAPRPWSRVRPSSWRRQIQDWVTPLCREGLISIQSRLLSRRSQRWPLAFTHALAFSIFF